VVELSPLHKLVGAVALALVLPGCIEFGGPLIADEGKDGEEADAGTETSADTGDERCGPSTGTVERVVDGDTIILTSGERIRYILVDTPEITLGKNECWGSQASDHNAAMVLAQTVTLTYDVECEDVYGRLLAYVEVGGVEVNRTLLESGDACYLHIAPNGNAKAAEYLALESAAKQAGTGMWSACATVLCD
jgi:micrococcal nuclease